MESVGNEGLLQLKRIKKLESRVDQLGALVQNVYSQYDNQTKIFAEDVHRLVSNLAACRK